mmetsp:Transcript_5228/g.19033  ORF Transcript_5228/g.19033 Transcript_5228/m.19033 type:complete len:204 (-) Transcript_5228:1264-1875(-)
MLAAAEPIASPFLMSFVSNSAARKPPQKELPHPVGSTTFIAHDGAEYPTFITASYTIAPSSPMRRHKVFPPASAIALIKSFAPKRSPATNKLRASRMFGLNTSAMLTSSFSELALSGFVACVNGSTEINCTPAPRKSRTRSKSGRTGFRPKWQARGCRTSSGHVANLGRSIEYSASSASMRHICVRRPSFSVICHARGVGIPL